MKHKLLFFIIPFLFIGLILLFFAKKKEPPQLLSEFEIINSIPTPGALHSPLIPLEIYFNKKVNPETVTLTLFPKTNYTVSLGSADNIIVISPQANFNPETTYQLTLSAPTQFSLTFTTDRLLIDHDLSEFIAINQTQNEALIKIRRSTPITQPGFTLNFSYKNSTYIISLSPPYEETKTQAINWLKLQGVTNLNDLRIEWKQLP